MLTESDKEKLKALDEFIPEYIRLRKKIDNVIDWSEEYKWKILPALNEKLLFKNITNEKIKSIFEILRKSNPNKGSFVFYMEMNKLIKLSEKDPNKLRELLDELINGEGGVSDKIQRFITKIKDINPMDSPTTPLIGYLFASYDCKNYPIYKDEIFQSTKTLVNGTDWLTDQGSKYQKYQEICLFFGEKLKSLLSDREIRGVNVKSGYTALDGQDFLFTVNEMIKPRRYWKIAPGDDACLWPENLKDKNIRIGWKIDVSQHKTFDSYFDAFKEKYPDNFKGNPGNFKVKAKENWDFANLSVGDIVIANKGLSFIMGIGKVSGEYVFDEKYKQYKQTIKIDWIDKQTREIPKNEKVVSNWGFKTVKELSKEDYKHLIDVSLITNKTPNIPTSVDLDETEEEEVNNNKWIDLWIDRKNIILYGPPGTSKTFFTDVLCADLFSQLSDKNLSNVEQFAFFKNNVEFITFHPSYQYEHFIEGLTVDTPIEGKSCSEVSYVLKPGIFKNFCKKALGGLIGLNHDEVTELSWKDVYQKYKQIKKQESAKLAQSPPYVMVIDEINRGDISKIFGELITLIEPSKRLGEFDCLEVKLPLSGDYFSIPPNLYIIATMNTADRSIALLDVALRRRFSFIPMMPSYELIKSDIEENKESLEPDLEGLMLKSIEALKVINSRICHNKSLGRDKQIGHTYLLNIDTTQKLFFAWKYSIYPLLEEYCYNNFTHISNILFNKDENDEYVSKEFGMVEDFNLEQFLLEVIKNP